MGRLEIILALAALGAGCHDEAAAPTGSPDEAKAAAAPIRVERATAEAVRIPRTRPYLGTLTPDRVARLAADTSGRVTHVHVDRGTRVAAGDVLIEVDPALTSLSAEAAEAQAALARAQWGAAKADCTRLDTLEAGGAVAPAQAERARAGCEAQARAVEAAEAQVKLAGTQVARSRVRAPFGGVVAERMVQVGEFVGPGSPVAMVMTLDPMRVRFSVPERDVATLQTGGRVQVRVPALGTSMIEGAILPLPPTGRDQLRDILVEAELPNADGRLLAGLSADVRVVGEEIDAVAVPTTAVLADDTAHRLWVIRDGRAVELLVHVDAELDGRLAVSPGLAAGEAVVNHPSGLRDGALVE